MASCWAGLVEDEAARAARADAARGPLSEEHLREEFGISAEANEAFDAALAGGKLPESGALSVKVSATDKSVTAKEAKRNKRKSGDGKAGKGKAGKGGGKKAKRSK